jgi:hypothetical protein
MTLEEMEKESDDNNFGMALQLKDLFWSAESFDAGEAMEAALSKLPPNTERQANVTNWLRWLEKASYQQNIRFLNDQRSLRDALISGELDWITCWSSSLRDLRQQMQGKLALAPLPKGPSTQRKATTKLQVWSLGTQFQSEPTRKGFGDDRLHQQTLGPKKPMPWQGVTRYPSIARPPKSWPPKFPVERKHW